MNLQELRTKLLEEFKHVGWLESCKGSCQGKRKPQKSSDSSSCLRAGSPRVPVPHRHLHCAAIPEGCWAEGRRFGWDLRAVLRLSGSDASRRVPFCSTAFYSNSHSALWIFCYFFFLHCQDFWVKRRCRKARHDQVRGHDLAQLTAASRRAVASHILLICTEIKIPQKLVVLATLLRKDWKAQCFVKTVKDKHCHFPSLGFLHQQIQPLQAGFRSRGNSLLLALPTDWKAHAGKAYCLKIYHDVFSLSIILWLFFTYH